MGISSNLLENELNNIIIGQSSGESADNPFLLIVATMLNQRQRTPTTFINVGDMYYAWQVVTPNIIESDLFLQNYSINYQTSEIRLSLTSYVNPSIRGQADPIIQQSLVAGGGIA
ncbi:MAG: hypothetical protein LBH40_00775 [Alphaproteobacteria bacterium]|jgi:hypothetical protein|nr:hypothetical protein [Alphaproteobacteria bacterium]